ncbi:MAG TPA: branched-chain amino acid ABC transporter permease [Methylomirabilota bacterium]|nr:branched-chain amino acid ABC transporter permease [Methylomirabilota bacterium]
MIDFLQALIDGVMLGATYALLGLGFTLIFGVLGRLNLAFGPTILVGISAGSLAHRAWPGLGLTVVAVSLGAALVAGLYVERCAFRPLRHQAPVVSMVASFAVAMQLQELVALAAPSRTMPFPAPAWLPALALGPVLLRPDALLMWGGATVLLLALFTLLYRTRFGAAVRAVSESPEGAALVGIDVGALGMAAFLLASAVGGVAGLLIAQSHQQVTPYFGLWATVKGLTAMLLGGAGSLAGAVAGGLVLGVVETETLWYLGGQFRDLVAYALLLVAIAARPRLRPGAGS